MLYTNFAMLYVNVISERRYPDGKTIKNCYSTYVKEIQAYNVNVYQKLSHY